MAFRCQCVYHQPFGNHNLRSIGWWANVFPYGFQFVLPSEIWENWIHAKLCVKKWFNLIFNFSHILLLLAIVEGGVFLLSLLFLNFLSFPICSLICWPMVVFLRFWMCTLALFFGVLCYTVLLFARQNK